MTYSTCLEVLRLDRLRKRAEAYLKNALESGNRSRMFRAARLLEAASSRGDAIAMGEVTPYRP
jgi:hypothetical protein